MKRQNEPECRDQNRISIDFGKIEVLEKARLGPKIGILRVVSSHPLTLREPD
ncbi:MAG: hypothetical protein OXH56_12895 [Gemmatimonadetes bacterium]|nr:hypothetical protein [Gemmatimonadota bacterium]